MLLNYLKIAWRNLIRSKINSGINIAGLAIGILCVIFIALYVQDDLSFDKGFRKSRQIYQVNIDANFGGQTYKAAGTPPPVGIALHDNFPEIETYTRVKRMGREIIHPLNGKTEVNSFTETGLWAVDSNFLQVFDYPFLEGNALSSLQTYHSVVLTRSAARKYFGSQSAIGKNLLLDEYQDPFVVTGVLKDLPSNASLQFSLLIPMHDCPSVQHFSWSWIWCQMNTYVVLKPSIAGNKEAVERLESHFPAMVSRLAVTAFRRIGQPFDEFLKKGGKWNFFLQPLTDIHLYSGDIGTPFNNVGDIKYVYIFSLIAVFIIVLACVNFMNLSTAQALRRAKEVGIRKVLGSLKGQLIRQFLAEALLYTGIATVIAVSLTAPLMPAFNNLSGKTLQFSDLFTHGLWLFIFFLFVLTGLLAGSYPAFYLTSFRPIEVLKGGKISLKRFGGQFIRNGLVVFQFTVSIVLVICTLIVFRQLRYMQEADLGFAKENVVLIPNMEKLGNNAESFRKEMNKLSGISNGTISTGAPAGDFSLFTDFYVPENNSKSASVAKDITLSSFMVDEDFLPALQLKLIEGRNFSKEYNDSASVIINETTARQIGWTAVLGKTIRYPGGDNVDFKVIGVVKDFNLGSLRTSVMPFVLFNTTSRTNHNSDLYLLARTRPGNPEKTLTQLAGLWKQFSPSTPFEYSFLDQDYAALYSSEQRLGNVFTTFTLLSIIVACMGLFGLSVYTAERRTKEIGIRKILGATERSVVILLSGEFLRLVVIAALISFPLAWWSMNKWLEDFAYRLPITAWTFLTAGAGALTIALVTVSFQAIRAAWTNPAKSLRSE